MANVYSFVVDPCTQYTLTPWATTSGLMRPSAAGPVPLKPARTSREEAAPTETILSASAGETRVLSLWTTAPELSLKAPPFVPHGRDEQKSLRGCGGRRTGNDGRMSVQLRPGIAGGRRIKNPVSQR